MTDPTHASAPVLSAPDPWARHRQAVQELGLTVEDPELDAFATRLAKRADTQYAMVNIVGADEQHFVGLHNPAPGGGYHIVGRTMPRKHGYCPDIVERTNGTALILPNVYAHPRFAGNEVVDQIGIATYAGAPLVYEGMVLGTLCFVGCHEKPWETGQASLALIKESRDELMDHLLRRR